jgi:hypothetical protein
VEDSPGAQPSARRRQLVGGGGQHTGQLARLSRGQIIGGKIQADDADPARGTVLADNIAHDKIAVRAWPLNDPTKTFDQGAHGASIVRIALQGKEFDFRTKSLIVEQCV